MYAELKAIRKAINYLAKVVESQNDLLKQINTRVSILENRELRKTNALEKFEQSIDQLDALVRELTYQIRYKDDAGMVQSLEDALSEYSLAYQSASSYDEREYYYNKIVETKKQILALEGYDV